MARSWEKWVLVLRVYFAMLAAFSNPHVRAGLGTVRFRNIPPKIAQLTDCFVCAIVAKPLKTLMKPVYKVA